MAAKSYYTVVLLKIEFVDTSKILMPLLQDNIKLIIKWQPNEWLLVT